MHLEAGHTQPRRPVMGNQSKQKFSTIMSKILKPNNLKHVRFKLLWPTKRKYFMRSRKNRAFGKPHAMSKKYYYFTFKHPSKAYVKIEGTYAEARAEMFRRYDNAWAFQHTETEFEGQAEQYGLTEIQ